MPDYNLDEIKTKLQGLDAFFDVANSFASGIDGLPKNGAVAVSLHKLRNAASDALKALDDPQFAAQLTQRHLHEHTISTMLRIRGAIE